jgi:hypothetical protein
MDLLERPEAEGGVELPGLLVAEDSMPNQSGSIRSSRSTASGAGWPEVTRHARRFARSPLGTIAR